MGLLPADRIVPLAARLLAQQPEPPRRVSLLAVLPAFGPLGLMALPPIVVLLVVSAFVGPRGRPYLLAMVGLLLLAGVALGLLLMVLMVRALTRGRRATGQVLTVQPGARGGLQGRLRLQTTGGVVETDYAWGQSVAVQPGDRIEVLVDPEKNTVMLALGRAA